MGVYRYLKSVGFPIIFLLFLFLLNPYSLAIESGYALLATILIFKGKLFVYNIDKDFLILLCFGVTYTMFNYFGENKGIQYLIIQATFPPFFYALGKIMVPQNITNKAIFYILLSIGFIYSITPILSIVSNLMQGGFVQHTRSIPLFWDGKVVQSTGMAMYLLFNAFLPAMLIVYRKRISLSLKVFLIIIYGVTLICGFRLGSRTLLVIAGFSFLLAIFIVMVKQSILENIKFTASLIIIGGIVLIFFPIDFDSPVFSTLGQRFKTGGAAESTGSAGNRTGLWMDGLQNLVKHPLGWKSSHYHHNLWLDTPKVGGIIPLIFLLVHNISCFKSIQKLFYLPNIDLELSITFLLYFVGTYLLFFTEPVLEGNFEFFVVYCLFFGILKGYVLNKEKEIES